jgi:S-layer protein
MGAGDDTLAIAAGTTAGTIVGTVTGGDGTDTLSMGYADAINTALSASTAFDAEVLGFESLTINNVANNADTVADTLTVDLANLSYDYVTVNGTDDGTNTVDTLALTNMAANGTVAFGAGTSATDLYTVSLADATGTADAINYVLASTNETSAAKPPVADKTPGTANDAGTITADDIETFNISSTAVDVDGATNVIAANGNAVTAINITGDAGVNLSSTATTLTSVDASGLTAGGLTFTAANTDMVIDGGAGVDTISLGATADKAAVSGGEGNDIFNIIAAGVDQAVIEGGAGADTFNFAGVSTNKSNYVVLDGVDSGDQIKVAAATSFAATEVTLSQGATESTQAYLDQAMTDLGANGLGWFQYNGNTFIAADLGGDSANSFVDGTDGVIMLTGLVDLSTASFNASGVLEIA